MKNYLQVTKQLKELKSHYSVHYEEFLKEFNTLLKEFKNYDIKTIKKSFTMIIDELYYNVNYEFDKEALFAVLDFISKENNLFTNEILHCLNTDTWRV